ncbi:hypothetical protein S83_038405 [Arachis hypogaea]
MLYNEMKRAFRQSAFILMRELSWRFFGHKIDWQRLFLLAAVLTVSSILFQMLVHRYLLNDQSPYENDSSHPSLNSSTTKEAILQQVRFSLPYSVILLNSSNEVVQSVAFESERAKTCLNSSISRSKREDKLADAIKNTRFSPLLSVPSYK